MSRFRIPRACKLHVTLTLGDKGTDRTQAEKEQVPGNADITAKRTCILSFCKLTLLTESSWWTKFIWKIKITLGLNYVPEYKANSCWPTFLTQGTLDIARDLKGLDSCFVWYPAHCHHDLGSLYGNWPCVPWNRKWTWLCEGEDEARTVSAVTLGVISCHIRAGNRVCLGLG